MIKKKVKKTKKTVKKTGKKGKAKETCGQCVFYVANKDKRSVGACFQVTGIVKENQVPVCKGKHFKQKTQ